MKNQIILSVFVLLAIGCIVIAFNMHSLHAAELAKAMAILFFFMCIKYLYRAGLIDE
jgi:hypothetical protein